METGVDPAILSIVAQGMREGRNTDDIVAEAANKNLGGYLAGGAAGGGILGALGSRVLGGPNLTKPFTQAWEKGVTQRTPQNILAALAKLPLAAKLAPAVGMGIGALGGLAGWDSGRNDRAGEAVEAAHGLTREKLLHNATLLSALPENHPARQEYAQMFSDSGKHAPQHETAHEPIPHAVLPGGK
jgi:hypothetical protein